MKRCPTILALLMAIYPLTLFAQRALPDDNLAYPVLINLTDCTANPNITSVKGSGFFLTVHTKIYLVTARHVLFSESERVQPGQARTPQCNNIELLARARDPKEQQQHRIVFDVRTVKATAHATHDVAVIYIGEVAEGVEPTVQGAYGIRYLPGVQVLQKPPSPFLTTLVSSIKKLDEVLVSNDAYILGYPSSIGIQGFPQIDYNAPLLRKGVIAGINNLKKNYCSGLPYLSR